LVASLLQRQGFLPPGPPDHRDPSWKAVLAMDPYELRGRALETRLEPWEFGRVMYHLAHRRGFAGSGRGADDSETGVIQEQIEKTAREMQKVNARTLGEFLAQLDPRERRRRGWHTAREWYRTEFEAIVQAQQRMGLNLDPDWVKRLRRAIFFQRPLRTSPRAVGRCGLVPGRLRAAWGLLEAQRFRYLQKLNDLRVLLPDGQVRPLTPQERELVRGELERSERLTFDRLRRLLSSCDPSESVGVPSTGKAGNCDEDPGARSTSDFSRQKAGLAFNLECGGQDCLPGNTTAARIRSAIGQKWDQASEDVRRAMVELLLGVKDRKLRARLALRRKEWALSDLEAERLAQVNLEPGRCRFSSAALRRLVPHLEAGCALTEAIAREFPEHEARFRTEADPPPETPVTNPLVRRALAETRRVVNAIVRTWGLPGRIHIELARELRKPLRRLRELLRRNEERQRQRKHAIKYLIEKGIQDPRPDQIEKFLLWVECKQICPYTGQSISDVDLFGPLPRFDVEHIIPWSRCLDDSFANKTLCEVDHNRNRKRNRMPTEVYSQDELSQILRRVRAFQGPYRFEKLRRFQMTEADLTTETGWLLRGDQLQATAHAARLAGRLLGRWYPAEERLSRIQITNGAVTSWLRVAWGLNQLLGVADEKNRSDHRHHLVDATVIALTTAATVKALTEAARRSARPRRFVDMPVPPGLVDSLRQQLETVIVSHRVDRRVQGPLHEETFYGRIQTPPTGESRTVVRKRIDALSATEAQRIVDPRVRELVAQVCNGRAPKEVFRDPSLIPEVPFGSRKVRIRHVRIWVSENPISLKDGDPRLVLPGSNHHLEIFDCREGPRPGWGGVGVRRWEAMRRLRAGKPVVRRFDEHGCPLVCSLARGETVRLNLPGGPVIAVVQKLSQDDYNFRLHTDGRRAADIPASERIRIRSSKALKKCLGCKLVVDVLGRCHVSRD